MKIDAVVFDVNETLFSLSPVRDRMLEVGLDADRLEPWFRAILVDGIAAAAAGRFVAFPDLARHHLGVELRRSGQPADDATIARVLAGFEQTTPHDDVGPAFEQLRAADVRIATLTNGTAAITRGFLERCGLDGFVDEVWDVEAVGCWKPAPAPYRWAVERLGLPADRVAMVAVHPWDIQGAMAAGLVGAFLERPGAAGYPSGFPQPDRRATSLTDLVERLAA